MEIAGLVFEKLVMLFSLMGLGLYLAKRDILTPDVTKQLSKLLTSFVAPSLILSTFMQTEFSVEKLRLFGLTILAALIIMLVRIAFVTFIFKKRPAIDHYASIFANIGFLGTPLVLAVGGSEAVFYISGFVIVNQTLQWTYGLYLLTRDKSTISLKSALLNPSFLATLMGLFIFCIPFALPSFLQDTMASFAQLNTPLSTVVLGTYFYGVHWREIFLYRPAYVTVLMRLVVTCLISLGMIWAFRLTDFNVNLALTIAVSTPTAMNTALFSQVYGGDYQHGSRMVLLTTLFSLISLPLMIALAGFLYL
ncbi:AEC family transporter [Streptococcus caprae]|uniref:AEC family transporter n=1 Tax=Streptococcus caprae TaxID=1640501 RepID=A0ABV8CVF9_9STRE